MQQKPQLTREIMLKRKEHLEQLTKRRFIYQPGFALYGGVAGLYDYGPVGCTIKNNIEQYWREHFIIEEDLLEVSATCLTPEPVLKASGHVDKFTDLLVTDVKTKAPYRADKVVTEVLEARINDKKTSEDLKSEYRKVLSLIDSVKEEQMKEIIQKYAIKAPETGNDLTNPEPFNLMLATSVGPSTKVSSFLRPETAQGIFLNFPRLLEQNGYKLPFGAAQIGLGFRNEIAPRNQLVRCREFQMAEIEYFVDPLDKNHKKFKNYKNFDLPLLSRQLQAEQKPFELIKVGQAVEGKIINNETLAYFMCRTYEFLVEIGIQKSLIRFRQHMADEMAHYSCDCWDAEIEMSLGWVECVGIADRSAFDLNAHSIATGTKLQAARKFKTPQQRDQINIKLDKAKIGKELKKDGTLLYKHIENLSDSDKISLMEEFEKTDQKSFNLEGKDLILKKESIQFERKTVNVMEEKYTPNVIEPSFGIGRILQALIEHSFNQRDDIQRCYFKLPPRICPVKCSILPVINTDEFNDIISEISISLKKMGISCKCDNSGVTIGKKYARTDEIGIPFGITVDKDTLVERTTTLREIETTKQIRIPIKDIPDVLYQLSNNLITWDSVLTKYPLFEYKEEEEEKQQ